VSDGLRKYAEIVGQDVIDHIERLVAPLRGLSVVHVNSTRLGGGVAEILNKMVPFMQELGLETSWEVINGEDQFFECTKRFHNGLQGNRVELTPTLLEAFEETNRKNAEELRDRLVDADLVVIHDPQPAPQLSLMPERKGRWIWRCHIDVSRPYRPVWRYLRPYVQEYDASVFSLADFAQRLPHPQYLIPPSIDPLSEKNVELEQREIDDVRAEYGLTPDHFVITQVSRFDRFKDPVGVIQAFRLAQRYVPNLKLVLAGGEATDDPEGALVVAEVQEAAGYDDGIQVLLLPPDAHRTINALQRISDIIIQKSVREGFGLTVTEGLWKGKPVIGGNTGGIRLQIVNHHTGFLVDTPEGAATWIRYLLSRPAARERMGREAHDFIRENYLLTRHLIEYLTLFHGVLRGNGDRIEID